MKYTAIFYIKTENFFEERLTCDVNVTYDGPKSHKNLRLHPLSKKYVLWKNYGALTTIENY